MQVIKMFGEREREKQQREEQPVVPRDPLVG